MTDYRELIAEEQGTNNFDVELTEADVEIEEDEALQALEALVKAGMVDEAEK